jgi:PII-like signaling protein
MYLNESDRCNHKPLHLEILRYLRQQGVAGASVFHAVAGFNGRDHVHTSSLVEGGGNLPIVLIFVDLEEHITRVLPKLREMAPGRLIVRENVVIEQSNL